MRTKTIYSQKQKMLFKETRINRIKYIQSKIFNLLSSINLKEHNINNIKAYKHILRMASIK